MTLCQINIAPAIIKLSQYSTGPAKCHYQAAKALMLYLNATHSNEQWPMASITGEDWNPLSHPTIFLK
jgi:hypothetical protein